MASVAEVIQSALKMAGHRVDAARNRGPGTATDGDRYGAMDSHDGAVVEPLEGRVELGRVLSAIESELDAHIEILGPGPAPDAPEGGRVVRLAERSGIPDAWLRVTPRSTGSLDRDTDRLVRVATRLLRHSLAQQGETRQDAAVNPIRRVLLAEDLWTVYQPICDLYDGSIVGYEALSRFPEPPGWTPDRWFSEATGMGMGVALEVLAIRQALSALPHLPSDVYLSVNVSPAAAASRELAALLENVPVERLVLEITEHTEVADYEILNASIARLRRRGARLAVDDTGAGFASMRHVLRLAPDIVKLDTTLTQDIDNDSVLRALGFSLKSFAAAIDAQVIAEGIETEREVDALRFLGVRYGQGFFLSRPGSLHEHQLLAITPTTAG